MNKKTSRLALAFIAALCLVLIISGAALAEPSISTKATPSDLVGSGTVEVEIVIKNTSDTLTMEDPILEGPQINSYSVGNIGPGQTRQLQIPSFNITSDQLGKAVSFKLSWTENGSRIEKTTSFTVGNRQATPKLQATRKIDKELVEEGGSVTFSYVLQNQGDVDITNIEITDPAFSEPVVSKLSLAVGESKTTTKQLTMGSEPVTSEPTVKYSAVGKASEIKIDPIQINVASALLDVAVQVKESNAVGTTLSIVIANKGNLGLTALKVSDELGNEIKSGFDLAPEKSESMEYTVTGTTTRYFLVSVTGTDSLKRPFTYESAKSTEVKPFIDSSSVQLSLLAEADDSALATTGRVKITFKISNVGDVVLYDAVINEETLGEVVNIGVLNTGETTKSESFDIKSDTQLRFSLKAADSAGNAYTASAKTIDIAPPGLEPTPLAPEETPEVQDETTPSPIQGTLLTLIIVIAVLLVAAVIALVVLLMQDKKSKAGQQDELDELEELLERPRLRADKAEDEVIEDLDMPWGSEKKSKSKKESKKLPRGPVRPSQGLPDGLAPSRGTGTRAQQREEPHPPEKPRGPAPVSSRQPELKLPVRKPAQPPPIQPPVQQPPVMQPSAPHQPIQAQPFAQPPTQPPVQPAIPAQPVQPVQAQPPAYTAPAAPVQPPFQAPTHLDDFDSGWEELDDDF